MAQYSVGFHSREGKPFHCSGSMDHSNVHPGSCSFNVTDGEANVTFYCRGPQEMLKIGQGICAEAAKLNAHQEARNQPARPDISDLAKPITTQVQKLTIVKEKSDADD